MKMRRIMPLVCLFLLLAVPASAELIISEVMTSNGVYINGEAYDWVEIHNDGGRSVDLSGCYLSDAKRT